MNAFLHKLMGLARTIPPFHESHGVWRASRDVTEKPASAATRCGTRHGGTPAYSGPCRPLIPEHAGRGFRSMPATHSGRCRQG